MKHKSEFIMMVIIWVAIILATVALYQYFCGQQKQVDAVTLNKYQKEYVLITDDMDFSFWQNVYESAKETAVEHDACLRMLGPDQDSEYTLTDYMKMSIASNVDGIIVHSDGSDEMREQIDIATDQGIPVVTVLEDDAQSKRICCVGVNSYQMGQMFAGQIKNQITDDTLTIIILLDEDVADNDIIFNQIKENIPQGLASNYPIEITSQNISEKNTFDSEESIRDIFVKDSEVPDILVCLSDVDTVSACQAVVDYNQVGNVAIIGSYASDTVLDCIQKGVVQSTIWLDTTQIGASCVEALEEYKTAGNVTDYISINLNAVTKDNISDYIEE